jgi:hypothetical protein
MAVCGVKEVEVGDFCLYRDGEPMLAVFKEEAPEVCVILRHEEVKMFQQDHLEIIGIPQILGKAPKNVFTVLIDTPPPWRHEASWREDYSRFCAGGPEAQVIRTSRSLFSILDYESHVGETCHSYSARRVSTGSTAAALRAGK